MEEETLFFIYVISVVPSKGSNAIRLPGSECSQIGPWESIFSVQHFMSLIVKLVHRGVLKFCFRESYTIHSQKVVLTKVLWQSENKTRQNLCLKYV